jgi:predicted DNA-binding transcriptional regulator AlpA
MTDAAEQRRPELECVETTGIQFRSTQLPSGVDPSTPEESSMPKSRTQFAARAPPPPPVPRLALSIPEFCEAHGISEGFFYKLKKQGEGPREMKVGARTLISLESAAEWRRARESQQSAEAVVGPRDPCSPVKPMAEKEGPPRGDAIRQRAGMPELIPYALLRARDLSGRGVTREATKLDDRIRFDRGRHRPGHHHG